jgi:hypothetical protein
MVGLRGAPIVVYRERIKEIVPHPEGVLVRFGQKVEMITPDAQQYDRQLVAVGDDPGVAR